MEIPILRRRSHNRSYAPQYEGLADQAITKNIMNLSDEELDNFEELGISNKALLYLLKKVGFLWPGVYSKGRASAAPGFPLVSFSRARCTAGKV